MNHRHLRTVAKLRRRTDLIAPLRVRRRTTIPPFRILARGEVTATPPFGALFDDRLAEIAPGSTWGTPGVDFLLGSSFAVPSGWLRGGPIVLEIRLGAAGDFSHPEALVYIDGEPVASCDRHHHTIVLADCWCDGGAHELVLHGWTGGTTNSSGQDVPPSPLVMGACSVAQIDEATRDLHILARVTLGVIDELDEHDPIRGRLIAVIDEMLAALDTREPIGDAFYVSVSAALSSARARLPSCGHPMDVKVVAAGHAHIDVAWLWTVARARRKAASTFHNALRLIDTHPDFHFTQSQPQLYEFVRHDQPDLFESIKKAVARGQWEPIGGMWVEADCNLTGGESLVRQLTLGRAFFAEHFGPTAETPTLWLPDAFGFPASLPQLLVGAHLNSFFTTKLSWNTTNRMPADSFWWEGIDGSKVLAHISPTPSTGDEWWSTYNATAEPADIFGTWNNYRHDDAGSAGRALPALMAYGWGDGGGGPTAEMVENLETMAEFPGTPRVTLGSARGFFEQLAQDAGPGLPTWAGELYLEYHQGTYTSQAAIKANNRRGEIGLHDAEFLAAWAAVATDAPYPTDRLREAWKLLCLNQFHDILPGSSIGDVYVDAASDHATVTAIASEIVDRSIAALSPTWSSQVHYIAINPCPFPGRLLATVPHEPGASGDLIDLRTGARLTTQPVEGGRLFEIDIPGYAAVELGIADPAGPSAATDELVQVTITADSNGVVLENDALRVELSAIGEIIGVIDKEHRRTVIDSEDSANVLQFFEDRPIEFDAWNLDPGAFDRPLAVELESDAPIVVERGPLRAAVEFRHRFGASSITQRVRIARGRARRIDFVTSVDWHETHVMLKVAFPVAVLARSATYEIQWGNVERTTHTNTSWDQAQHESCAHRWIDFSEADYGVSLLNDCKYGHDVKRNVMRLSLLRSPTSPDPHADQGHHEFTYSLLPHPGDWRAITAAAAYQLNDTMIVRAVSGGIRRPLDQPGPLISVDRDGVVIETVKLAEDGNGIIVRMYEQHRSRGPATLTTNFPLSHAERVDLLEQADGVPACNFDGDVVRFDIAPYEIITLRLVPLKPATHTGQRRPALSTADRPHLSDESLGVRMAYSARNRRWPAV